MSSNASTHLSDGQSASAIGPHSFISQHYLFASILLAFYGVAVCPFIETLTIPQLITPIVAAFLLMLLTRQWLWKAHVEPQAVENKITKSFKVDLLLFISFGLLLASYNTLVFGFPPESGIKVIVGMFSIGWFVSVDVALQNENRLAICLKATGQHIKQKQNFLPLTQKFSIFTLVSLLVVAITLLLVVRKDVSWLLHEGVNKDHSKAQLSIIFEFLFVLMVMIAYLFRIIKSYTQNANFVISNQNHTLNAVASGNLATSVPVVSNDEFGQMAQLTNKMIEDLAAQKEEIQKTRDTTILALSSLAETRDNETGEHIIRTQNYVKALAEQLKHKPHYKDYLTEEKIDLLYKSAPLHDIGKVGIPDKILLKPGKLTAEEFEIMKTHAELGGQAIRNAEQTTGENTFLGIAKEIAETHHEKWDGSGYPKGLKGNDIPLSGRLMALADVYDALISKRVYKDAFSHDDAKNIILEGDGKHFDPEIVQAFDEVEHEFIEIAEKYHSN